MRRRPKALGSTLLLTLLATLHVASSADAASVARQCRLACHDAIAACVAAGGRSRACRKNMLGRCKGEGLAVCQGQANASEAEVANRRRRGRKTTATTTTTTGPPGTTTSTTTRPPTTGASSSTTTTRPRTTTTTLAGGGGQVTGLHYAPNNNFDSSGNYMPGQAGFNLADVSSVSGLTALPSGVKGLVWLGLCDGADSTFIAAVRPFIGNPKLFGFYLVDEPDPTGTWNPLCPAANLMAESDWIHANVPGAKTFIAMMNMGTNDSPTYAGTYNPVNSHIDLYGLDPYPCRQDMSGSCDYSWINKSVAAAEASGVPRGSMVPIYQAFGGGNWGGNYAVPTSSQEQQILSIWASLVPNPLFDYAYSWGAQNSDQALEGLTALQAVFSVHNK